jgi:uncharacterized cupredoxin-like copper-binding protein
MRSNDVHCVFLTGKAVQLVWQFTRPGEFYYGCLIPGHVEAGMVGKVIVK